MHHARPRRGAGLLFLFGAADCTAYPDREERADGNPSDDDTDHPHVIKYGMWILCAMDFGPPLFGMKDSTLIWLA